MFSRGHSRDGCEVSIVASGFSNFQYIGGSMRLGTVTVPSSLLNGMKIVIILLFTVIYNSIVRNLLKWCGPRRGFPCGRCQCCGWPWRRSVGRLLSLAATSLGFISAAAHFTASQAEFLAPAVNAFTGVSSQPVQIEALESGRFRTDLESGSSCQVRDPC